MITTIFFKYQTEPKILFDILIAMFNIQNQTISNYFWKNVLYDITIKDNNIYLVLYIDVELKRLVSIIISRNIIRRNIYTCQFIYNADADIDNCSFEFNESDFLSFERNYKINMLLE